MKKRRPLGPCHALKNGTRCGAPATHRYYDWWACTDCYGSGLFSSSVSLLTEKKEQAA